MRGFKMIRCTHNFWPVMLQFQFPWHTSSFVLLLCSGLSIDRAETENKGYSDVLTCSRRIHAYPDNYYIGTPARRDAGGFVSSFFFF
jgi:hypothetical protein